MSESSRVNNEANAVDNRSSQQRLRHFAFILSGQVVSIFGSALTSFALGVWVFQKAGSVAAYTGIFFAAALGTVIAAPFAGTLVDRWHKKKILLGSSLGSAFVSALIAIFYFLDSLDIWFIIICAFLNGIAIAFSKPAITASVKILIDPDDLVRANGMAAAGFGLTTLVAPVIAGFLLLKIDLLGILLIDVVTFSIGIFVLSFLRLPTRELAPTEPIFTSIKFAWNYLKEKDALLWLIGFYFILNLLTAGIVVVIQPLILTFTDASGLGLILTVGGFGYLLGAILIGVWGGPKRKIFAIYGAALFMGIGMGILPLSTNPVIVSIGAFLLAAALPISLACNQAIIQKKVHSMYIGRVDGMGIFFINISMPVGYLSAGLLAQNVFEPFMLSASYANALFTPYYGVGEGRGIALMISMIACGLVLAVLVASLLPKIRRIELELKDEN